MNFNSFKNLADMRFKIVFCVSIIFFLTVIVDVFATLKIGGLDDAYITYTFAKNLANGHGIVWVIGGDPVYGSTTFTYTILLAFFGYLGFSIPLVSIVLGAIFWGLSNVIIFLIVKDKLGILNAFIAAVFSAISLSALNLSYGMETSLYTFLVLCAFLLYSNNKLFLSSIVVVVLLMTRPDGLLVPAMIVGHFLITSDLNLKKRFAIIAKLLMPTLLILISWSIFLYFYFGSIFPNSLKAKMLFDSSVSGLFDPLFYWKIFIVNPNGIGSIFTFLFVIIIVIGILKAIWQWKDASNLVFIWAFLCIVIFTLLHAPNSPWYYAPVIPVIYALFLLGANLVHDSAVKFMQSHNKYYMPLAILIAQIVLIIFIVQFVFTVQASYQQIKTDPFGEHVYENEERRFLSQVVLNDMAKRNITNTTVMAFEVGFLGYNIPGQVHDILGLVSPNVIKYGGKKNPMYILDTYEPEYVVIVDAFLYPPTAPIYQSFVFQSNYNELYSLPRSFGHNYKVFRRNTVKIHEIWFFDFQQTPDILHQTNILADDKMLIFESNSYDPYIIYNNLKTPIFENCFLYVNVSSQNSGIFELFFDYGNGIDYSNSVQFLLLGGNESQTSFAKIPVDNQIVGLRIDPLDRPGTITINNLSIWK